LIIPFLIALTDGISFQLSPLPAATVKFLSFHGCLYNLSQPTSFDTFPRSYHNLSHGPVTIPISTSSLEFRPLD
jgi:hypothetical protein